LLLAAVVVVRDARGDASPSGPRWIEATPEGMISDAVDRALAGRATLQAQLAAMASMATLADRAKFGAAQRAFAKIAADSGIDPAVRAEAELLALAQEGSNAAGDPERALGVVADLAILGPFRDTGGGLDAHDGPEQPKTAFGDAAVRYDWGSYDVSWRTVPPSFASARGVPLDVFVFPRTESCSWVATRLKVTTKQDLVVRLAASGQVRLTLDGTDVARDDAVNEQARFDRVAVRLRAIDGTHRLAAKVCTGALTDAGLVRLRITDESGHAPLGVATSADLDGSVREKRAHLDFRRIRTPLEQALTESASSPESRLNVALLRVLAGADDLRSPRAPGMLSALADEGPDSEHLALLAWLAPSGANRSAWLNRAVSDASAPGRVLAFAARRLVERRLDANLADWAMATLQGARIDQDEDGEAALLAAQVESAVDTGLSRVVQTKRLWQFVDRTPEPSNAVLETVARMAGSTDGAIAAAAWGWLAARGRDAAEQADAQQVRGTDDVIAAAKRAFDGAIDDVDDGLLAARSAARTGDHESARPLFEKLAQLAPNRAEVWADLASELTAAPSTPMRDEAAAAALRRARELDPGSAQYRAKLAMRTGSPNSDESGDERYLVDWPAIAARKTILSSDQEHDLANREIYWRRAVIMHDDGRVSEFVHYAREIVIAPRTEDELDEDLPAEGAVTEIVRARVHRKNGNVEFPLEQVTSSAQPRIRWPELRTGDVVEVAFRSWTGGPVGGRADPPFYRLDYAGSTATRPVLYNEVDVESPKAHPLFVDVVHGQADRREDGGVDGRHVVRLVWDRPVNVPDEPLAPPLSEVLPTVVVSTFRTWNDFRSWYAEAVRGFTEPDAQVRAMAAKLTRDRVSPQDKLRALFDFVADDIRYVNFVSAESWLPNRPQELLARREGDCDDKALLLITLLRAVGVTAQEVLVQTRLTDQPSILRADGAAVPLFDHGIAFLPGENGGLYLDATSPKSRLGPLPAMDAGASALRMDGPAEILRLPRGRQADHGLDSRWTLNVHSDGSAELAGEEHGSGDDAFWMRTYLTEPGARASWVEETLAGTWFTGIDVDKKVDFQGDLPQGDAVMRWRAKSRALAQRDGKELVINLSPSQPMAAQLAPQLHRELPVWLPPRIAPRQESRTVRVTIPPGWTLESLPPAGDEDGGSFGRAHFDAAKDSNDPNVIVVHRSIAIDLDRIEVKNYGAWRFWLQRVDALMHKSLRLSAASESRP
jgi:transglutaminase-like putative cysteine protease/tetratricopeptide (TPR) repeat protein